MKLSILNISFLIALFLATPVQAENLRVQRVFTRDQLVREVDSQQPSAVGISPSTGGYYWELQSDRQICVKAACEKAGSLACDDRTEILEFDRACHGNPSDQCLREVCDRLGYFACDESREVLRVLTLCGLDENSKL